MNKTGKIRYKSVCKRLLSLILVIGIVVTGLNLEALIADAATGVDVGTTQIYLVDNTAEKWLGNDNAVLQLVDNSNGHDYYEMTKISDFVWEATVPSSAINITFNRLSPSGGTHWNSFSAGGRGGYNAYFADGSEYGHWENIEVDEENYFHAGDIIYLDISEFTAWEKDNAKMYINFTDASKEENGGNDINILNADKNRYNPKKVKNKVEENVYRYIVTQEEEGAEELRFWRGNDAALWNCSVVLDYEDYKKGINCIKITGWDDIGEIILYEYEADEEKDTDEDSVLDYLEVYFGTDITKEDTDGDELSDYIELFVISSDPLLEDTDADGIKDGDEDADEEGLTNLKELEKGTDLSKPDTDSDKLNDYEELMVYGTDPLMYDTDEDGVSDGKEVELGTNPLVKDVDFIINKSSSETDTVKASVEIVLSGVQVGSLQIEKYENKLLFPDDMPGYIGGVYDFSVNGDFEGATIRFEFDSSFLADEDFEPVIYYFNEDKQLLEELETKIVGNIATADVIHFSKYILLDKSEFQAAFTWQDIWAAGDYSGVEVVLVIDDSSSMGWNDSYNQRIEVAKELVENLPNNSKIGVVKFDSTTALLTSTLTDSKEQAKIYLSSSYFNSNGNSTYMYNAINSSFSLFETDDESILKMMVVLSDGNTFDTNLHSSVINLANANDVKIYTVGLGNSSSYFTKYLEPLATNTDGKFYLAVNANELEDVYKDISNKIDIETDSDADGLPDYYEDNMVMFNGTKMKLDKNNPDMDGDGLLDGEEVVELNYQYNEDKTKAIVTGKLASTPLEKDSDYDGRADSEDNAPISNHFTGIMKTEYAVSDIAFDMDYRWFFYDNSYYNEDLSVASSLYASAIYHDNILGIYETVDKSKAKGGSIEDIMAYFGLNDVKTISLDEEYNDNHLSEIGIGYRTVSYNEEIKNIVAVVIRGTNGTIEEWSSNFDIGDISTFDITSDWKTEDNHKGFDVAANRIMKLVEKYVEENELDDLDIAYWLTGHSRGAAIANVIGAYYEKAGKMAYTYTYASPNTTLADDAGSYKTIFNVVNEDDFVTYLPMEAWGYSRYGKTASVSIADNYEKEWEDLTGIWDYDPDTFGMQDTINAMANIISSNDDPRVTCYEYTCSEHGNGSDDEITVTNYGMTKESREEAIDKIPDNALPYCKITRYDGSLFWGWDFDICQTPAYFMQLIAWYMANMDSNFVGASYRFIVELDFAERYGAAKMLLINSGIGGIKEPHYIETYYILAKNLVSMKYK